MNDAKEILEVKQTLEDTSENIDLKRTFLVADIQAYLRLVRSKLSVYEELESTNSVDTGIHAGLRALADFLQDKADDVSSFANTYDSLIHELVEIIKELDVKDNYKIEEVLEKYDW